MSTEMRRTESTERSIERILARRRARRLERKYSRAPDESHGDCRIDAVYEAFGAAWAESTLFAVTIPDSDGRNRPAGWTVGRFDDRFLEIEQGIRGEVEEPEAWMGMRRTDVERLIVLEMPEPLHGATERLVTGADCAVEGRRARLLDLERRELGLARDRSFAAGRGRDVSREERLLRSRIDLVSFICLTVRLA